jgi:uncharacterized protein YeeX (DUF496 family)
MAKHRTGKPQVSLEIVWDEPGTPLGPLDQEWGQLIGGIHRLMYLTDELSPVLRMPDLRSAVSKVLYTIENYLHRAYELRERAFELLAAATGEKKLRDSRQRWKALDNLDQSFAPVRVVSELARELDSDIKDRNRHTDNEIILYSTPMKRTRKMP